MEDPNAIPSSPIKDHLYGGPNKIPDQFKEFSELVKYGIAIVNGRRIVHANKKIEEYTGYSLEELRQMDFTRLISPEGVESALEAAARVMNEMEQSPIELTFIRKDGDPRYIRLDGDPVVWEGESYLFVSAVDITDRHEALERMKASEQKYMAVLERSPNNIYLVDMETMKIIEANSSLHDLLGYEDGELIGRKPYEFIGHEIDDVDEHIRGLPTEQYGFVGPRKYRRRDGKLIDVEVSANVIEYMGRKVISVVSWDVTELKHAHEEIMELNEILRLISRITRHDIRNKLTIALGINGLMKDGHSIERPLIEESYKAIMKAIDITKRMNELESLIISKKALRTVELRDLIEDIIVDHSVKYHIEGACHVDVDETFSSVIENLVGNSIFHGGADRLDVSIENEDGSCLVKITDNGKGINKEVQERIFEEGFSYGENRGTGLGLFIVKKVMERYGGEVWLEDSSEVGSTFILRLPL
jgi:PAS domain S-box-containing protein